MERWELKLASLLPWQERPIGSQGSPSGVGDGWSRIGRSVEPTGDWEKHRHVVYFPKKNPINTHIYLFFST